MNYLAQAGRIEGMSIFIAAFVAISNVKADGWHVSLQVVFSLVIPPKRDPQASELQLNDGMRKFEEEVNVPGTTASDPGGSKPARGITLLKLVSERSKSSNWIHYQQLKAKRTARLEFP